MVALSALFSLLLFAEAPSAAAHAQLVKSSPPADALLAVPPHQIDLYMSERVATVAGSPLIKVLDENGRAVTTGVATVDAASQTHITAAVSGIGTGAFTVVWTTTSADDGHSLTGTFAFRVGGTDRAPGAATTEGERPRPWAVATRWITFFGAGIAAAAFLFRGLEFFGGDVRSRGERRRMLLAAGGAGAAFIATALEPVLQSQFPAQGVSKASVGDAISALPSAWWLRGPGLLVATVLALGLVRWRRGGQAGRWLGIVGTAVSLVAILGLALTTHTAARASWHWPAVVSIVAHEWAGALWVGGLVCLVFSLSGRKADAGNVDAWSDGALRRFSKFALAMVAILGVAGLANAVLIFPTLRSVWTSDFGRVLIAKSAILALVLGLAAWHRLTIRRGIERLGEVLRSTIRLETGLVAAVVLGGTIMALLAPPLEAAPGQNAAAVDLAAQLSRSSNQYVRFQLTPAKAGQNAVTAFVTTGIPVAYDANAGAMVDQAPMDDVALIRLKLTSLNHDAPPVETDLAAASKGVFTANLQFSLNDWWQVDFTIRRLGVEDETAITFLLLPDPNVNGFGAPRTPESNPAATSLFQRGLANLTSIHSTHYVERLGGGVGTFVISDQRYRDDSFGDVAAMEIDSTGTSEIRTNGQQWIKSGTGAWELSDSGELSAFSAWGDDFAGAVGFQLGTTATLVGRDVQMISFYVPGAALAPAWYTWWVSTDTGEIMRLTMVSRGHYMERDYLSFNTPLKITLPGLNPIASPAASPVASPAATPGA